MSAFWGAEIIHLSSATCHDLFWERHFVGKHRNVKYACTSTPRTRAFSLINHAITVFVKIKQKEAIAKKYCVNRFIVSYCSSISLIIVAVIAAQCFDVQARFFFTCCSHFADPLDFMACKLIPRSMVLNYSVIYAGHGLCNQQFVHAALICRIAALVLCYLIIGRYRNM